MITKGHIFGGRAFNGVPGGESGRVRADGFDSPEPASGGSPSHRLKNRPRPAVEFAIAMSVVFLVVVAPPFMGGRESPAHASGVGVEANPVDDPGGTVQSMNPRHRGFFERPRGRSAELASLEKRPFVPAPGRAPRLPMIPATDFPIVHPVDPLRPGTAVSSAPGSSPDTGGIPRAPEAVGDDGRTGFIPADAVPGRMGVPLHARSTTARPPSIRADGTTGTPEPRGGERFPRAGSNAPGGAVGADSISGVPEYPAIFPPDGSRHAAPFATPPAAASRAPTPTLQTRART